MTGDEAVGRREPAGHAHPGRPRRRRRRYAVLLAAALAAAFGLVVLHRGGRVTEPWPPPPPRGLPALFAVPADNALLPAKVELGRRLFGDPRLSRDGSVSCASCHRPELAFSDGRLLPAGIGDRPGRRHVPSLVNVAWRETLFWDGRAASLEEQALQPIENPSEMGHSIAALLEDLRADPSYRARFESAFGSPEITADRLAKALASFERTILAGGAPFDRYVHGGDEAALSAAARRGLALFENEARCRFCHEGTLFTDQRFHNTGVGWGERPLDLGRYEITGRDEDRGRFKTLSLRELVHTAPYMHDGSLGSLEAVVEFYDRGGNPNPHLDPAIRPLGLTERQKADLVEFLESLTAVSDGSG